MKHVVVTVVAIAALALTGGCSSGSSQSPAASSSPPSTSGVPADVQSLAQQYNQGDDLVFNCAFATTPGINRAACLGRFFKTAESLQSAAEGLSASKARGDLLQAIDDWMSDRNQYIADKCYFRGVQIDTSNSSADCDAELQGLEDQWRVMLSALGY